MVVDGQSHGPWDQVAEPMFSRDGRRFAFLAQDHGQWRAVVDGVAGPLHPIIQGSSLRFSLNGDHVGYVAELAQGCVAVVTDQTVGACHDGVTSMRITANGAPVAAIQEGNRFRFLFGSSLGPPVDAIGHYAISEDGKRAAYAAREGGVWRAVIDGVPGLQAEAIRDFQFGNEGARLAFSAADPARARVVVDGAEGPPFLLVGRPVLAAHGTRVVYQAEDAQGAWVVVDGQRQGPFAAVLDLVLSADGSHLVFVARKNGQVTVNHDGAEKAFAAVVEHTLVLSDDGEHWAVIAGDPAIQRLWISIDGQRELPASSEDVFGDSRTLRPWLDRLLATAVEPGSTHE
jgi:hypothetical protein